MVDDQEHRDPQWFLAQFPIYVAANPPIKSDGAGHLIIDETTQLAMIMAKEGPALVAFTDQDGMDRFAKRTTWKGAITLETAEQLKNLILNVIHLYDTESLFVCFDSSEQFRGYFVNMAQILSGGLDSPD